MFTLVLAILVGILGGICWVIFITNKRGGEGYTESKGWTIFFAVVSVLILIISFVMTGIGWSDQISDIENLKKFDNLEQIYKRKAEALTNQFSKYLADAYPQHERNIFDKISPEKVDIYLVKYPKLQASKTIIVLTEKINQLQADRYAQQISKEESLKNIRFRLRNPWIWYWLIPEK